MLGNHMRKFKTLLSPEYLYSIEHEDPYKVLSKKFGTNYKAAVNTLIKRDGYRIENFSAGYCYVSGFITDGERYVYFSTSDFRYFPDEWKNNVLIRSAKHNKDYTGGPNQYTTLEDIHNKARQILEGGR